MLHHIVFAKIGVPDYTCKTFTDFDGNKVPAFAQRFYARGRGADDDLALPSGLRLSESRPPTAGG